MSTFTVYAENPLISDVEQTVRNISARVVVDANGELCYRSFGTVEGEYRYRTITDLDGKFTLSVPANRCCKSYIGYKTAERKSKRTSRIESTCRKIRKRWMKW